MPLAAAERSRRCSHRKPPANREFTGARSDYSRGTHCGKSSKCVQTGEPLSRLGPKNTAFQLPPSLLTARD